MATKTLVVLEDDIDGGTEGVRTVELSVDGVSYEVDLSTANQKGLTDALAPYLAAARRTGGRRKRGSGSPTAALAADSNTVRTWAQANNIEVSSRGRISAKVREQFAAANS